MYTSQTVNILHKSYFTDYFIHDIQMKEQLDPPTDPILEEIYRMKAEFNAQFNGGTLCPFERSQ
jgi:hypothetical protein